MKILSAGLMAGAIAACSTAAMDQADTNPPAAAIAAPAGNPLVMEWTTPFGAPPFDQIRAEHYIPAIQYGMALHNQEIAAITRNRATPTFDNTILALERSGQSLNRTLGVYYNLTSSLLTPELAAVQTDAEPMITAHFSSISLNQDLFQKVRAVYEARNNSGLNAEQIRLVERIYIGFQRNGALLDEAGRTRLAEIDQRLATLGTQFGQNMLADTAAWTMELNGERDLAGLPDSVRAAALQAGTDLGQPGKYLITLQRSSVEPFLTYSTRRDLRERAFRAWSLRGDNGNEYDNNAIIREVVTLRLEKARLLGYETWAHYQIADRMAETPDRARDLMMRVWRPAVARVAADRAQIQQMIDSERGGFQVEAWDWRFYAERVRLAQYNLSETEIRPYLQLDNIRDAMFHTATRLWGVTFVARPDVPVYHPDVSAFEVKDRNGRTIGLYYFDPFARPTKDSGAWMNSFRDQQRMNGEDVLPIVVNCLNLSKAAPGEPTLMSWDDAETLFHEFGHSMHGLLSNVTYPTLSGTSVARDYVEFPSQVYEHWLSTDEILNRYAVNAQGQPMPADLIARIRNADTFNQGWSTVEFLGSGIVEMDLALLREVPADFHARTFEQQALAAIGMPREIIMRHRLPHFGHVFTNDYSAGYYGYLWAEVLEEDAYGAFVESGDPFDAETAQRFCEYIFCAGNLRSPMAAFVGFRGREPSEEPLLRSRGFAD